MQDKLNEIRESVRGKLSKAAESAHIEELRVAVLGRKGELTALLKGMGKLSPEERPAVGQKVNALRQEIEGWLDEKSQELAAKERQARLDAETLDISIPGEEVKVGNPHPLSTTLEKIIDIFVGMGFSVAEGPEVELDKYNFELLNLPKDHPARDAQDTFYFNENILLRTHTSPVQARTMLSQKPPIRVICPGRVYRADEVDATHSPVFSQCEGLVIDEGITMGDLKGTLDTFARELYGEGIKTRFRPSFFPFTEPSAEVDVTCAACKGEGCRICKGTGWIEILGAGMVNPHVLEMCGIDPQRYTGFAFGIGIERVTNLKYNVPDMRLLFENDLRFLSQFGKGRV
jgi:phenylalanyl-tRNA synthetase alpha chain